MIRRAWAGRRYIWITACIVGYATLAHYTNSNPHGKNLGVVLAAAPPLALGLGYAWRRRIASARSSRAPSQRCCSPATGALPRAFFRRSISCRIAGSTCFWASPSRAPCCPAERPLCTQWADRRPRAASAAGRPLHPQHDRRLGAVFRRHHAHLPHPVSVCAADRLVGVCRISSPYRWWF